MEEIYATQAPFLVALKERMSNYNPDTTTIGDLFQVGDGLISKLTLI